MSKTMNDLHADESRKGLYSGKGRQAVCICGQHYDRIGHIWLGCPHPALCSIRQYWRQNLIEEVQRLAPNSVISPTEFVDTIWTTKPSEGGCVVDGAEEAERQQYRETLRVPTAGQHDAESGSEGSATGSDDNDGGGTDDDGTSEEEASHSGDDSDGEAAQSNCADGEDMDEGSSAGDDAAPSADTRQDAAGAATKQIGWAITGKRGRRERYGIDWNELGDDPPRRALEVLKEAKYNLTLQELWTLRVTQDIPALMSTALGLDQGGGMLLFRRIEELVEKMTNMIWKEYTSISHEVGSAVYEAKRKELLEEWAALKSDMRNMTDGRGNQMVSLAVASKWGNALLEQLNLRWRKRRDWHHRRLGVGQRTITATMNVTRTKRKRKDDAQNGSDATAQGGGAGSEQGGGNVDGAGESKADEGLAAHEEDDGAVAEGLRRVRRDSDSGAAAAQGGEGAQDNRKRAAAAAARRSQPGKKQTTMQDWANRGRGAQRSATQQGESAGPAQGADVHGAEGTGNEGQATDPDTGGPGTGGTDGREDDPG